jgi:hypothetical protein
MKRMLFVLALTLPAAVWAGVPAPQEVPAPAQPTAHPPVFQVKYVLLTAPKEAGDMPRIDYDGRSAALVPLQPGHERYKVLDPFASSPNVEICRQWACEFPGHR